jgi:hypothetical protein
MENLSILDGDESRGGIKLRQIACPASLAKPMIGR